MPYLDFISLRRNCSNRLVKSPGPSPSEDAFLLDEFTSDSFIDQIINKYKHNTCVDNSNILLQKILLEIEQGFEAVKYEIDQIKNTLISRAYNLFADDRQMMEIDSLKHELRQCHAKVLKNNINTELLEEFALIFNYFKEKAIAPAKSISSSLLLSFQELLAEIQADINKTTSACFAKSMREIVCMPEIIPEKQSSTMKSCKLKELIHENHRSLQGCWLELESKSSLLCFGYDRKVGTEPLQAKLYATEKGKLCYSITSCDRLPHAYSRKLNCLAFCYPKYVDMTKMLVIDLHRITSHGVKKIAGLSMELDPVQDVTFGESPLLNPCHLIRLSDIKLSFVDHCGLLIVKQAHKILVINLFTRKILYQREYPEGILDINYIKDFHSVVVLTTQNILIYKVSKKDYSFAQIYSLSIVEDNSCNFTSGRTFVENHIILVTLNQTYKTEPHSTCFVVEIFEPKIRSSSFLVLSPFRYVPVIQPAENKISLFGILPWHGFSIRKTFTYFLQDRRLKEEQGSGELHDHKEIIYADSFRTILQKKLESGGQKIIYGTREALIQRTD